jgi:hypothetical protein
MKRLELAIESIILASRWLLVIFYLGLGLALAVYAVSFGKKLVEFMSQVLILDDIDTILKMLGLIDAALVASLVVMVIISGYENFVGRFDPRARGRSALAGHDRRRLAQGQGRLHHRGDLVDPPPADIPQRGDLYGRPADVADHHAPRLCVVRVAARLYRQDRRQEAGQAASGSHGES